MQNSKSSHESYLVKFKKLLRILGLNTLDNPDSDQFSLSPNKNSESIKIKSLEKSIEKLNFELSDIKT